MAMTPANRQKLYAARQKDGLIVVPVLCVELDVIDVLQAEGFLDHDNPTRAQLSEALSKWLFELLTRHGQERWPDV